MSSPSARGLLSTIAGASWTQQVTLVIGAGLFSTYLVWYLYRFSILPSRRPNEPRFLAYQIPFIGHAIGLLCNQKALLHHGWQHFQSMPFALTAAGKTLYILTNLADINAVYKSGSTISFDYATRQTMLLWGISAKGDEAMHREGHSGSFPNPNKKTINKLMHDIMRVHLEAPCGLKQLADDFQARLEPHLAGLDRLPQKSILKPRQNQDSVDVSLLTLCQEAMIQAGSDTFFGETLRSLHKNDFVKTFTTFDDNAWKIFSQLPRFTAKECFDARDDMISAMCDWLVTPRNQRAAAAPMIAQLEDEMLVAGMPHRDIALILFFMNWLFNVNSFKLSFWMVSWIISDPQLQNTIREEVLAGSNEGAVPSIDYLVNECPSLNAVFDEAQRLTVAALSSRAVLEDTIINGWMYRAGGTILIPYKQLHSQTSVFGDNINEFDHTRFLNSKNLGRNPNFKPFGGGNTLCTGRFLARREVLMFVGLMFTNWEMEKISEGFPETDLTKPSLGTMEVKAGHDMQVRLRPRKSGRSG